MFGALLAGMFAGFAVAVPVGVIAVLIIETGMMGGLRRGLAAGAGAATVDLLFCSLALLVGGLLNQFLSVALVPLQVLAGGVLISIGVRGLLSLRASSTSADAAQATFSGRSCTLVELLSTTCAQAVCTSAGMKLKTRSSASSQPASCAP